VTEDARVQVLAGEAVAMLAVIEDYDPGGGPQPCVHSYRQSGVGLLLGAFWPVEEVRGAIEKYGAELSGPYMAGMGHGLAVTDETGVLFFATKEVPAG
jgi:hypothetical protein